MPNKFVKTLFDKDYQKLVKNYQTSSNFRVRNRSRAILLSFQKYAADEIAQICRVHRMTICIWIDKWNAHQKLEGLNKIEMLWKKIKYDWPSWKAYSSYKNLCQELDEVLSQIGSLYRITFA